MKTARELFDEYALSHQNRTNKVLHWICVPVIFWSFTALLYIVPFPFFSHPLFGNWAAVVMGVVVIYYFRLALSLGIGMTLFTLACLGLCALIKVYAGLPLWPFAVAAFVSAWTGQFIGHHIEGRRPSFFKELQFFLIGPPWLLGSAYRGLGIAY